MRRSQGLLHNMLDDLEGQRWYENKKPQDVLRLSQVISQCGFSVGNNMSIDSLILLLQNTQDLKALAEHLIYMQNIQHGRVPYESCVDLLQHLSRVEAIQKTTHILFE